MVDNGCFFVSCHVFLFASVFACFKGVQVTFWQSLGTMTPVMAAQSQTWSATGVRSTAVKRVQTWATWVYNAPVKWMKIMKRASSCHFFFVGTWWNMTMNPWANWDLAVNSQTNSALNKTWRLGDLECSESFFGPPSPLRASHRKVPGPWIEVELTTFHCQLRSTFNLWARYLKSKHRWRHMPDPMYPALIWSNGSNRLARKQDCQQKDRSS